MEVAEESVHQSQLIVDILYEGGPIFKLISNLRGIALVDFHRLFAFFFRLCRYSRDPYEFSEYTWEHFDAKIAISVLLQSLNYTICPFKLICVLPSFQNVSESWCCSNDQYFVNVFIWNGKLPHVLKHLFSVSAFTTYRSFADLVNQLQLNRLNLGQWHTTQLVKNVMDHIKL